MLHIPGLKKNYKTFMAGAEICVQKEPLKGNSPFESGRGDTPYLPPDFSLQFLVAVCDILVNILVYISSIKFEVRLDFFL